MLITIPQCKFFHMPGEISPAERRKSVVLDRSDRVRQFTCLSNFVMILTIPSVRPALQMLRGRALGSIQRQPSPASGPSRQFRELAALISLTLGGLWERH